MRAAERYVLVPASDATWVAARIALMLSEILASRQS